MSDVNFLEYGANALRVPSSFEQITLFLSLNGYFLGVILALVVILGLILFLLVMMWKKTKGLF